MTTTSRAHPNRWRLGSLPSDPDSPVVVSVDEFRELLLERLPGEKCGKIFKLLRLLQRACIRDLILGDLVGKAAPFEGFWILDEDVHSNLLPDFISDEETALVKMREKYFMEVLPLPANASLTQREKMYNQVRLHPAAKGKSRGILIVELLSPREKTAKKIISMPKS